jgi:hypothetical protein
MAQLDGSARWLSPAMQPVADAQRREPKSALIVEGRVVRLCGASKWLDRAVGKWVNVFNFAGRRDFPDGVS